MGGATPSGRGPTEDNPLSDGAAEGRSKDRPPAHLGGGVVELQLVLVAGHHDEGLLGEWGVPGHGRRDSTLLDAILAQETEVILAALGEVVLHLSGTEGEGEGERNAVLFALCFCVGFYHKCAAGGCFCGSASLHKWFLQFLLHKCVAGGYGKANFMVILANGYLLECTAFPTQTSEGSRCLYS